MKRGRAGPLQPLPAGPPLAHALGFRRGKTPTLSTLSRTLRRFELHYVRDVTLGEDACRVRAGHAPQVLAALRNAVVHLLAGVPARSHPEAIELLQINPVQALDLIGIPQIE